MSVKKRAAVYLILAVLAFTGVFVLKRLPSSETVPSSEMEEDSERMIADQEQEPAESPEQPVSEPEQKPDEDPAEQPDENPDQPLTDEDPYLTQEPQNSEPDKAQTVSGRSITREDEDYCVIPDRYNCGAKGNLTKVLASDTVNGVQLYESGGINVFDLYRRNTEIQGEIHFNSYDFSDYIVAVYNADLVERDITLVFENCKFSTFRALTEFPKIKLVFKNCSFNRFLGSCAEFTYCKFGDYYLDGFVPYHDVSVKNCYFSNFSSHDEAASGVHTDGTQIYGKEGVNAENIRYENCRFEMPSIPSMNSINTCIMLQMEFSNGINILINNCICNGGGYSLYATAKDKGFQYYENVVISNIGVGMSRKYGALYPTVWDGVSVSNIYDIDSLYVASVWKQGGATHLSVTNDTLQDRLLVVYADGEKYEFTIPATRGGQNDYFDRFEDYPIDLDICINADCKYVVCFDRTMGADKQIRFISWDGSDSVLVPWE